MEVKLRVEKWFPLRFVHVYKFEKYPEMRIGIPLRVLIDMSWYALKGRWFDLRERIAFWLLGVDRSAEDCRHCDYGKQT